MVSKCVRIFSVCVCVCVCVCLCVSEYMCVRLLYMYLKT